jgi:hypothetical protein
MEQHIARGAKHGKKPSTGAAIKARRCGAGESLLNPDME